MKRRSVKSEEGKTININKLTSEVEKDMGKISQVKRDFAVEKVVSPGKSNSQIAREVGTYTQPDKMGWQLSNDPKVLALTEKIKEVVEFPVGEDNLTVDMVTKGLAKEAFEASNSRDRREAFHLLGKSRGMFRDVVEIKPVMSDADFLKKVEKDLGKNVAAEMADNLGLTYEPDETIK